MSFRTESAFEVAFEWSEPREARDKSQEVPMRDRLLVSVAAVSRTTDFVVDPRAQMIHRMQIRPSLNSLEHGLLGLGRNRHEALVSAVGQGFHGMFRRLRRGIATTARKRRLQRRREMPVAAKRQSGLSGLRAEGVEETSRTLQLFATG